MKDTHTTLREEFSKFIKQYKHLLIMNVEVWQITDFWLSKLHSHNDELVKKVEGLRRIGGALIGEEDFDQVVNETIDSVLTLIKEANQEPHDPTR